MTEIPIPIPETPPIGFEKNMWRTRDVTVYAHPTDPTLVVSVGVPFGGDGPRKSIVCIEPRMAFDRAIKAYPRTVTFQ